MSFLDKLSDGIANTTKDLGNLAANATDITKLQYDKKVKEGELTRLYEKLGKKYYEAHKDDDMDETVNNARQEAILFLGLKSEDIIIITAIIP